MPTDRGPQVLRDAVLPEALIGNRTGFAGVRAQGTMRGDLLIAGGRVAGMRHGPASDRPRVVLPAPVEAHVHLDKCHTIDRLDTVGGDLAHAIAVQADDKANWTSRDVAARAGRGLAELAAAGCVAARSHVDWGDTAAPPMAWEVLTDLARDWRGRLDLNCAALTHVAALADPDMGDRIARHVARAGGALGTFVLGQPERRDGIAQAFALADRYGLALDFHVDEGLDPGLDGLEIIAETAISTRFQGPVLCGHACALMNAEGDRLTRFLDRLAESGVHVAALPVTNLYLQGRQDGTPERRGLTRVAELTAAGVPVVIGSDNVRDAFCPVGRHDPMAALALAILAGHLDPPLDRWLTTVTTAAAAALGRLPVWIAGAPVADLRISTAADLTDLFTGHAGPLAPLTDTELETPCP